MKNNLSRKALIIFALAIFSVASSAFAWGNNSNRYSIEKEFALVYECVKGRSGMFKTEKDIAKNAECCANYVRELQKQFTESQLENVDPDKLPPVKCKKD